MSARKSIGIWRADRKCESDWGVIEYTRPRPERDEVGHLLLISAPAYARLMVEGPRYDGLALGNARIDGDPPKMFYDLEYQGKRWTWELFKAHWTDIDNEHRIPLYIGRWPD